MRDYRVRICPDCDKPYYRHGTARRCVSCAEDRRVALGNKWSCGWRENNRDEWRLRCQVYSLRYRLKYPERHLEAVALVKWKRAANGG